MCAYTPTHTHARAQSYAHTPGARTHVHVHTEARVQTRVHKPARASGVDGNPLWEKTTPQLNIAYIYMGKTINQNCVFLRLLVH